MESEHITTIPCSYAWTNPSSSISCHWLWKNSRWQCAKKASLGRLSLRWSNTKSLKSLGSWGEYQLTTICLCNNDILLESTQCDCKDELTADTLCTCSHFRNTYKEAKVSHLQRPWVVWHRTKTWEPQYDEAAHSQVQVENSVTGYARQWKTSTWKVHHALPSRRFCGADANATHMVHNGMRDDSEDQWPFHEWHWQWNNDKGFRPNRRLGRVSQNGEERVRKLLQQCFSTQHRDPAIRTSSGMWTCAHLVLPKFQARSWFSSTRYVGYLLIWILSHLQFRGVP